MNYEAQGKEANPNFWNGFTLKNLAGFSVTYVSNIDINIPKYHCPKYLKLNFRVNCIVSDRTALIVAVKR